MNNLDYPHIDTNVFLRFLVVDKTNPHLSRQAKSVIKQVQTGKLVVQTNICIVSELVYVLEGYYELPKPEVAQKVITLVSLENIHLHQKAAVLSALLSYRDLNVDFEDAYTYSLMKENQVSQIYTFDQKHFKRFPQVEIISQ